MTHKDMTGPVGIADVIIGVRYGLAFDAKGRPLSVKKRTSKCRRVLEMIPEATTYRPRRDGAVSFSLFHRKMEERWRELSWIVQWACMSCPLHAQKQCPESGFPEGPLTSSRRWQCLPSLQRARCSSPNSARPV